MRYLKGVIFILVMMFFVGCATSALKVVDSSKLVLEYDSSSYLVASKKLARDDLNFKDLYVKQYKLQTKDGDILFYEDARTDLNFEFNFGGLYTVLYIFDDAQSYDELCERNNLKMLQIKLKDGNYVNVILQASDTQEYSYVYGFSNEAFMKIYNTLRDKDDEKKVKELKHKGITFNKSSKNVTNWNDNLVFLTPLITPLRVMGRF